MYRDSSVMIFAISKVFLPRELHAAVNSSPHRPARPNPLWVLPRQPAIPSPDEAVDPLAGAHITVDSRRGAIEAINADLSRALRLSGDTSAHIGSIVQRANDKLRQYGAIVDARPLTDDTVSIATVIVGRSSKGQAFSGNNIGDRGSSVSAVVEPLESEDDVPTNWQLTAGARDGMVLRGFSLHSSYSTNGVLTEFRTGLALAAAVSQSSRSYAPTVVLSLGAVGAEKLIRDLADPAIQEKWVDAIVDGVASMLRQNRHLVTTPEPELSPEFAELGAHWPAA